MPRFSHVSRGHRASVPAAVSLSSCRVLLVIDNRPLQHAAWSEFHTAQKRSEKAARDLQRHEETDTPAYTAWIHSEFPELVTMLRELHTEVRRKAHDVEHAHFVATLTGRPVKKVWREHKEYEADPEAYERKHPPGPEPEPSDHADDSFDPNRPDDDEDGFPAGDFADDDRDASAPKGVARARQRADEEAAARDVYRRLVQHLHPDRGGEWTPARERLWHEVQQAWNARDADWLARLEIDWETANDVIGPDSSLGRLRRAIAELHSARRDTERRLREYRRAPAWRFTMSEKKRPQLRRRLERELHEDFDMLQRHLAHLNATIASWEAAPAAARRRRTK